MGLKSQIKILMLRARKKKVPWSFFSALYLYKEKKNMQEFPYLWKNSVMKLKRSHFIEAQHILVSEELRTNFKNAIMQNSVCPWARSN